MKNIITIEWEAETLVLPKFLDLLNCFKSKNTTKLKVTIKRMKGGKK